MTTISNLPRALLALRLGVFLVMFMWTLDKFIRPDHAAIVYEHFYFIGGHFIESWGDVLFYIIGALEMIILIGFLLGIKKFWTYGFVLVVHAVSTLSSYQQYIDAFEAVNLLFYAAWPMLAACYALFILRDQDTLFTVKKI